MQLENFEEFLHRDSNMAILINYLKNSHYASNLDLLKIKIMDFILHFIDSIIHFIIIKNHFLEIKELIDFTVIGP